MNRPQLHVRLFGRVENLFGREQRTPEQALQGAEIARTAAFFGQASVMRARIHTVFPGRVEHWRAQPQVGSFRSPLFRLWSGCLVRPSPTVPAAPPKIPYGGFSPVRLQAQAPRSLVWSLPRLRSALKSDP